MWGPETGREVRAETRRQEEKREWGKGGQERSKSVGTRVTGRKMRLWGQEDRKRSESWGTKVQEET